MKLLFLSSAAALAFGGAAFAQDAAKPAQPPAAATPASPSAAAVSDAEVAKVAALAADVRAANATSKPKIDAAADEKAKADAQKQLDDSIQAALAKSGLTMERYNEIASAAQTDKTLAARISAAANPGAAQGSQSPASATANP